MRIKNLIIVFFSILTLNSFAQEGIFEKVYNKTWFEEDGFAGTTIVFFKTSNGLLKAIRQINGSGVPVVGSEIYDVKIRHDTIYLSNGLNLKTAEQICNNYFYFDKKTGQIIRNGEHLRILDDEPILYTWTNKRKDFKSQIDVRLLTEIKIEKNEIYKEEDLNKILMNK